MDYAGWSHYGDFHALDGPRPGTVRLAVGEAMNPHVMMVNHPSMPQEHW